MIQSHGKMFRRFSGGFRAVVCGSACAGLGWWGRDLGRAVEVGGLFFARWIGFTDPLSAMLRLLALTFVVIFEAILMEG